MNRVVLSREEGRWFSRNVLKSLILLESRAKKDKAILERTTYKVLKSIKPQAEKMDAALKAFGDEEYELELMLASKQKSVVKTMIEDTQKELVTTILPVYEARGLDKYRDDVKNKIELLKSMSKKFK